VLLLRRTYVQPKARQCFRSGATTGHHQHRSRPTVHNWELCIMAKCCLMTNGIRRSLHDP